jgi:hypothetical protein
MQVRKLPATRGIAWLRDGVALYRRNPLGLTGNVLLMFFCLLVALIFGQMLDQVLTALLPPNLANFIGQLPFALLLPVLSVGVFNACRAIERGEPVLPGYLFSRLGPHLRSLLMLGGLYYLGSTIALGLISLTDGGLLFSVMQDLNKLNDKQLDMQTLRRSALLLTLLSLLLTAANWFAPLLTGWRGLPPVKSAFFSIVACWRNLRAFIVFGLACMGLFWILLLCIGILLSFIPALGSLVAALLPLLLMPILYGAFYANVRDVLPELFDAET